jgi:hypothetical protein
MSFQPEFIDLGAVKKGDSRKMVFDFENTGNLDFMIELVTSCNCTTIEWPVGKLFKPGEGGQIQAVFDSTEKEKSETVDVDVILRENDPITGYPKVYTVQFKYVLEQ